MPHPAAQGFHPSTFIERGAFVPFTTPVLGGTRVRPGERAGLDLLVPNPSGGRGDYVLPWTSLPDLCRPTVHDRRLLQRIAGLRCVTPASIRHAARAIAGEGLAGREASTAASESAGSDAAALVITNFALLLCLVEQTEARGPGWTPPASQPPAEIERRARRVMAVIAPRLRQDVASIAGALEDMAVAFTPIGLRERADSARLPHGLAALRRLRQEVAAMPHGEDEEAAGAARLIVGTADITLAFAAPLLREAQAMAEHIHDLLLAWRADPGATERRIARPDWLMDGWERICRIWTEAVRPTARRDALDEIVSLLPVIPREAGEWVGRAIALEPALRGGRPVLRCEDWRTGLILLDRVARNERLLADVA